MSEYPEHDKLTAIPGDVRRAVGDWIESVHIADWGCPHGVTTRLGDDGWDCEVRSCRHGESNPRLWESSRSTALHIADIFGIDYAALMAEKDAMLDSLRSADA